MWSIDKANTIRMTRGDTPTFQLNLKDGEGNPYVPAEGDEIRFVIKKDANEEIILAEILVPTDTLILRFSQETTRYFEFGKYVYEISLNNNAQDYHDTFIANKPIIITEELA